MTSINLLETQKDFILENISDGVCIIDNNKKITYWNKGAEEITGFSKNKVIGKNCHDVLNAYDSEGVPICSLNCPMEICSQKTIFQKDVYIKNSESTRTSVILQASPLTDENNNLIGIIEIFSSFTVRNAIKKFNHLRDIAFTEENTGMPNRKFIEFELDYYKNLIEQANSPFGIALITIDNYFEIAGEHGFLNTEKIFRMFGTTFKMNINDNFTIGRFSDNIIMVIIPVSDKKKFNSEIEKIKLLATNSNISLTSNNNSFFNKNINIKFNFFTEFITSIEQIDLNKWSKLGKKIS